MNKSLFHRIFRPTAIVLAAVVAIPASAVAVTASASAAPKAAAPVAGNTAKAGGLVVSTAEDSIAPAPAPRKGATVGTYKWIINVDPTGDTSQPYGDNICHPLTPTNPTGNANFPDTPPPGGLPASAPNTAYAPCAWPSVHQLQSSQLISSGTDADWNANKAIPMFANGRGLKDGKYLVSVLANGYQLGGSHFQVVNGHIQGGPAVSNPAGAANALIPGAIAVNLNPWPIALATARLKVYSDMASTNSQWDEQTEQGIKGFEARVTDFDGQVTSDYYNNPLCTAYVTTGGVDATTGLPKGLTELGLDGRPIVDPLHHWQGIAEVAGPSTGRCLSDANGEIAVPNIPPNRYGISVIAPAVSDPAHGVYKLCPTQDTTPNTNYPVLQEKCWVQTDTIEGNHDIDVWLMANDNGLDSEQVVGGEPVPWVRYGYVLAGCMQTDYLDLAKVPAGVDGTDPSLFNAPNQCLTDTSANPDPTKGGVFPHVATSTSTITGRVAGANAYIPGVGGIPGLTGGTAGTGGFKLEPKPDPSYCKTVPAASCQGVKHAWVALSDLSSNDRTEYVMPADQYGNFTITGVPDGTYNLAIWDQPQNYIFDSFNVTVTGSTPAGTHTLALGELPLLQWFAHIYGHVFIDTNGNGRQDPGEPGIPDLVMQNLNRTNNAYEQGQNVSKTDDQGYYDFTQAYPLGAMNVEQFFFTRYKTIGITYQACNDPQEHTYMTPAVDLSYNPIISQCGRVDIGVQPYATGQNGGIVATVFDQTVRNKYLGRQQLPFDHNVGIPGFLTELFQAVKDPVTGEYLKNADGSYKTTGPTGGYTAADRAPGAPNAYISEHYGKAAPVNTFTANSPNPSACVARDANGNSIQGVKTVSGLVTGDGNPGTPTFQDALPGVQADGNQACIEAPLTGINFVMGTDNTPIDPTLAICAPITDPAYPNKPATYDQACPLHGVQTVDGNYALTPVNPDGSAASGDFLTKVNIPGDTVLPPVDGADRPLWKVTTEQDVNVFGPAQALAANSQFTPGMPGITPEFVPQGGVDWANAYKTDGSVSASHATSVFSWPPRAAPGYQMPAALINPPGSDSPTTYNENAGTYAPAPDPQCAGPTFTVNVTDTSTGTNVPGTGPNNATNPAQPNNGRDPNNPNAPYANGSSFLTAGGSPVQGAKRNLCDVHLIHVQNGQSVAPNFLVYSDVPPPAMYQVQIFDDISTSVDKRSTQYGEVASVPNAPIGVYDYAGNLMTTVNSDPNGIAEVLMPSTDMTNCTADPAAECSQVYRFVGNDPGTPDAPNANWNPQYSTIAAQFQAMPGVFEPADVAPNRGAATVTQPDAQFNVFSACKPPASQPQFFSVNRPYTFVNTTTDARDTLVINGANFGTTKGTIKLDGSAVGGNSYTITGNRITGWTPTTITVSIDTSSIDPNPYQLLINVPASAATLATTVKALTYHVVDVAGSGNYAPKVYEVGTGPGAPAWAVAQHETPAAFTFTQDALEAAAGYAVTQASSGPIPGPNNTTYADVRQGDPVGQALVVVYPLAPTAFAPLSARYENLALHSNVKVQGVGPGGFQPSTSPGGPDVAVPGTIFDGRFFNSLFDHVIDGDVFTPLPPNPSVSQYAEHALQLWYATMSGAPGTTDLFPTDNNLLTVGQIVTVLGRQGHAYTSAFPPGIDGVGLTAAEAVNGPSNTNTFTGNKTGPAPVPTEEQGGAIYLNGHADFTQITNNSIYANGGAYGAIRVGTPQMHGQHNHNVEIANNSIVANNGANLAGAIGLFNDSSGYAIHNNVLCGNLSAEYGGAISQNGFAGTMTSATAGDGYTADEAQANSTRVNSIANNKIELNYSYDEGGGITIAGELNSTNTGLSIGSGPLDIAGNYLSGNLGNDDGGALRFLMAGNFPIHVVNNMITNNVSTHEGGGIAIDDTPQISIVNNTIAKNITTATAATSNGTPAPAGISTAANSTALQATLPAGAPIFSDPVIQNDLFFDNRAGTWTPTGVTGIGQAGDATPINLWDVGTADASGTLLPVGSVLNTPSSQGFTNPAAANNISLAAGAASPFMGAYDTGISITAIRNSVRFRPSAIVNFNLPANVIGDYSVPTGSPVLGIGFRRVTGATPVAGALLPPLASPSLSPLRDINNVLRPVPAAPANSPVGSGAWYAAPPAPVIVVPAALPATPVRAASTPTGGAAPPVGGAPPRPAAGVVPPGAPPAGGVVPPGPPPVGGGSNVVGTGRSVQAAGAPIVASAVVVPPASGGQVAAAPLPGGDAAGGQFVTINPNRRPPAPAAAGATGISTELAAAVSTPWSWAAITLLLALGALIGVRRRRDHLTALHLAKAERP